STASAICIWTTLDGRHRRPLRVATPPFTQKNRPNSCRMRSTLAPLHNTVISGSTMAIEIKAPTFPESVADGTVATWHQQPAAAAKRDELLVDTETVYHALAAPAESVGG